MFNKIYKKVMSKVEEFYRRVISIACEVCGVDPIMMFSCKREKYVDARNLVIMNLTMKGYTDTVISELTGLTRQAVNYVRNTFPSKYNRSWMLITYQDKLIQCEIDKAFTAGINYTDRKTCKMVEGVVVVPNEPTITGYGSYCCFRNNTAAGGGSAA